MASPQLENGYTRISNELMEALARTRISGESRQVLDVIVRKTYGFGKKRDVIALSQFVLATGMKKTAVCKGIVKLIDMGIITKKGNDFRKEYGIVKDFELWKPLPKKITSTKKDNEGTQKRKQSLPKKIHTIEKKETIQKKEIPADAGLSLDEYVSKMRESPRRYINLIGEFADEARPSLTTEGQWRAFTSRYLRVAKQMEPFTDDQIGGAFSKMKANMKSARNPRGFITEWDMNTLFKYLTK